MTTNETPEIMGNFGHLYQLASIHWLMRMWPHSGWYITIICGLQIGKWMWAMGIILPALKFVLMMLPPLNKTEQKIAPLGRRQKGHQLRHASLAAAGTPSPEIFTGETWICGKNPCFKKSEPKNTSKWWWFNGDESHGRNPLKKSPTKTWSPRKGRRRRPWELLWNSNFGESLGCSGQDSLRIRKFKGSP